MSYKFHFVTEKMHFVTKTIVWFTINYCDYRKYTNVYFYGSKNHANSI